VFYYLTEKRKINSVFCAMIKKIIAFNFILIASFIILAHDLVPHHHHDEVEAIEQFQTYSTNSEKEPHHNFPEHEHLQDDYLYVIRQSLILSPNLGRFLDNDDDFTGNTGLDNFFINSPTFLIVYSPPDYKIPYWDNPQNFITNVTYTFGLRAPPAIV
jgi:hypothetical protein